MAAKDGSLNDVHMGVLKPEYIQRANSLAKTMRLHAKEASKAESMARHPAAGSRRKELMDSALSHTERSFQAGHAIMDLNIQHKSSFPRRSAEFQSARNAAYN